MLARNLLIIALVWPEPNSTAAGCRMLQLIHFFLKHEYKITIASTAAASELSMDLGALGISKASIQLNHSSFDEFVRNLDPEIVLFDRFLTEEQFGWRVAEFAPKALRILDTEDLHSLRNTREKAFKSGIPFTTDTWLQEAMTKREVASIYRSDIALIISSYEMYLLKDVIQVDKSILMFLPFMLSSISKEKKSTCHTFENRSDFICIGNGKHAPNIDAIVWLKTDIWPLIKAQLPEANLKIYGAYLPEHVQQMHNEKEGFFIEGWAENVNQVMQEAKANLAPLRFGAGLKGKIITAMQNGTPCITTSIGVEGMNNDLVYDVQVANTSERITVAALELYTNKAAWKRAQASGFEIVNTLYDKNIWNKKFSSKIKAVQNDLENHRKKNFVGTMLSHQSLSSTKYMSKWIEEKNKK